MSRSINNITISQTSSSQIDGEVNDKLIINNDTTDGGVLINSNSNYNGFVVKNDNKEIYLIKNEFDENNLTYTSLNTLNCETVKCNNIYSTQSTTINSINLQDNSIILNKNSVSDVNDTGIYMQHASNLYTGLVRDQSKDFCFVNISTLPNSTMNTFTNSELSDVKMRDIKINRNLNIYNSNGNYNSIITNATQNTNINYTLPSIAPSLNGGILSVNTNGSMYWNNNISAPTVKIGSNAGQINQQYQAIAIGNNAGQYNQAIVSVAIGNQAGQTGQSQEAIAIGQASGLKNQAQKAIAIGGYAGSETQGLNSIAIGSQAGNLNQGDYSISIGNRAGIDNQGAYSIAIGNRAGENYQSAYSICLNASDTELDTYDTGLYINPIRQDAFTNILGYNDETKEITYDSITNLTNNLLTSDYFYLYSPRSTYRIMSLQPFLTDENQGFKKNYFSVPANATITEILIESVGESSPLKYDLRLTVKKNDNSENQITTSINITNSLTTPSSISNFTNLAYYNSKPPYDSNLLHHYPFSYNCINVADTNYKSLIGNASYTQDQVKIGVSSLNFNYYTSLITPTIIPWNGSGSTSTNTSLNSNGYSLISFWFQVNENFKANNISGTSLILTTRGIETGNQYQNRNIDLFIYNTGNTLQSVSQQSGALYALRLTSTYNWNGSSSVADNFDSGAYVMGNGTWNHIAIYLTPTRIFGFLNGKAVFLTGGSRNYAYDNSYLTVGAYPFQSTTNLNGYMSDLRVYNATSNFLGNTDGIVLNENHLLIYDYFINNITTSDNIGNTGYVSILPNISVQKNERVYLEIKEDTVTNTSNFDELVSAKLIMKLN